MWNNKKKEVDVEKELANSRYECAKWRAIADAYRSRNSNDVDGQWNVRTQFYRGLLWRIVGGCYEITYNPKLDWDSGYIISTLIRKGYVIFANTGLYGVSAWEGGLEGIRAPYRPERAIVKNQFVQFEKRIGDECEIVYLNPWPYLFTYQDIVDIYAEKLASCDAGIDVNIINSKLAYVFFADNKRQADRWKSIYKAVTNGKPAFFVKQLTEDIGAGNLNSQVLFNNLRANFIAPDMQNTKRMLFNEFYTLLSINNVAVQKKERLTSGEVESNNQELLANTQFIADNLEIGCKKVNNMFPMVDLKIEYRWRDDLEREIENAYRNPLQLQSSMGNPHTKESTG